MINKETLIEEIERKIKIIEELKKVEDAAYAFNEKHARYSKNLFYFTKEQIECLFPLVNQSIYDQLETCPVGSYDLYQMKMDFSIFGIQRVNINSKLDHYKELLNHLTK